MWNFEWGFNSKKYDLRWKKLELPEMARTLMFQSFCPLPPKILKCLNPLALVTKNKLNSVAYRFFVFFLHQMQEYLLPTTLWLTFQYNKMSNSLEHPVFLSQVGKLSTWMTQRGERQGSASREEQWLRGNQRAIHCL